MDDSEVASWVDSATEELLAGQEPQLDELSIAERQAIIDRIREKTQQFRAFAESGKGLLSKPDGYVWDYKHMIDALLGLSMRVDLGIAQGLADQVAEFFGAKTSK